MNHKFLTDKKDIIIWLDKYGVSHYCLVENEVYGWTVNVLSNVDLGSKGLTDIPVKFNHVSGYFSVSNNRLKNLDFSPVKAHSFYCDENSLTSIVGAPKSLFGSFDCSYNLLKNLTHGPIMVGGAYSCSNNDLQDLMGMAKTIGAGINCSHNKLVSLVGSPEKVNGYYLCMHNPIKDLKGCPSIVEREFYCGNTLITSFINGPEFVGSTFVCDRAKLTDISDLNFQIKNNMIDISGNQFLGPEQEITDFQKLKAYIEQKNKILSEADMLQAHIPTHNCELKIKDNQNQKI